jgi:hypothetical protein
MKDMIEKIELILLGAGFRQKENIHRKENLLYSNPDLRIEILADESDEIIVFFLERYNSDKMLRHQITTRAIKQAKPIVLFIMIREMVEKILSDDD